MSQFDEQYLVNHRRQKSLVLVISLLCLLLAIAPRQGRALFITPGMNVKAFGAVFPPVKLATLKLFPGDEIGSRDTPSAFFARTPGRPVGASPFASPEPAAGSPGSGTETPVGAAPPTPDAGSLPSAASPVNSGGGLPFIPVAFNPTNANPIGSVATPAVTATPTPVATPTPTPVASSTPVPVAAVPEPATWLMLIVGFFGVGLALRVRGARRFPIGTSPR